MRRARPVRLSAASLFAMAGTVVAQPSSVQHAPSSAVFGEPVGVTQREPDVPREDEAVEVYFRVGFQFTYDRVAVYYTSNGVEPFGSFGTPQPGATQASTNANGQVQFVRNEVTAQGVYDWWKWTVPASARGYGQQVRYKIGAWSSSQGGEVQASGNGIGFIYTNKLAWPGAGAGSSNPSAGYPPVSFWKEEAFIGNRFTAAMLDQNGTWWDMYFPTPGGIQGVGSLNEGYSDGPDTFPPLLAPEKRGQMHLQQAQVGIRVDGLTHWLSNPGGVSYGDVQQSYLNDETNTVKTSQVLTAGNSGITVEQFDFAPAGVAFPEGSGGTGPQRHILVKRMILRNNTGQARDVNVYTYLSPALNGGNGYDVMFWDASRGAMTAYDKTRRTVTGTGAFIQPPEEYNITTFGGYEKNVALYLSAAMKTVGAPGSAGGTLAADAWADTSGDASRGWIGQKVSLPAGGVPVEVNVTLIGAHLRPEPITAGIPLNDGVYDGQIAPALSWFASGSMASVQGQTDAYWASWLNQGTTIDTPDDAYDRLMKRGLLATALHQDEVNGGVVAGYHNGAYYYVWPRDAMWAAVTLARTGHLPEAKNAIRWMREKSFRDVEPGFGTNPFTGLPVRGFWKQKCTTDGFTVWGAPQIDGTAVFPWAVKWVYDMTGDASFVTLNAPAIYDGMLAMTRDSVDPRLYFVDPPGNGPGTQNLVYSNNLWEDQYDTFTFSNANIVRGLADSASLFGVIGQNALSAEAASLAATVKSGLDGRLAWDGENTDISLLGTVYPFGVYSPTDPLVVQVVDRINGVRTRFNNTEGQSKPLVRFAGFPNDQYGWTGLIDRYWADSYWGGGTPWGAGPWFLTTMWYGAYYAQRQDLTAGKGDIDNHKFRLDRLLEHLGPVGLGAEQIAPRAVPGNPGLPGSLLYAGQDDFTLQTAWPNAWESMSFFVDSMMLFLGYTPDGASNTMRMRPKLPTGWGTLTFRNVELSSAALGYEHRVDTTVTETAQAVTQTFTNTTGLPLTVVTRLRIPAGSGACVTVNGLPAALSARDVALGVAEVSVALSTGAGAVTTVRVGLGFNANCDGSTSQPVLNALDFGCFLQRYQQAQSLPAGQQPSAYANCDGSTSAPVLNALDFSCFLDRYRAGCR